MKALSGNQKFLITVLVFMTAVARAEDINYKNLSEVEAQIGVNSVDIANSSINSLLTLSKNPPDHNELNQIRLIAEKITALCKKINDKKLGSAKLSYKKLLLNLKN